MSSKSLPKDTFFSSPIQRLCQKLEWLFNLLLTLCSNVCVYSISILIFWFSYVIELSRLRPCYLLTLFVYSLYCMFVWWWGWRMVLLIFPQPLLAGFSSTVHFLTQTTNKDLWLNLLQQFQFSSVLEIFNFQHVLRVDIALLFSHRCQLVPLNLLSTWLPAGRLS